MTAGPGARVLLVGGGAQAKYALETLTLRGVPVAAVMDLKSEPDLAWPQHYGCPEVGFDPELKVAAKTGATHVLPCAGTPQDKRRVWETAAARDYPMASAIHPDARIATTARVGAGTIINAGAVIQPLAAVGDGAMIHANVVVEHDCRIGDFANLAPGVALGGWVVVETAATVFTGASVIPAKHIGAEAVVGAGATVIHDVEPASTVGGVPARLLHA